MSYGWVRYRRQFSHLKLRTFLLLWGDFLEGAVWNRPVHTVKTMGVLWNPRRHRNQEWQKRSVDSTYDGWRLVGGLGGRGAESANLGKDTIVFPMIIKKKQYLSDNSHNGTLKILTGMSAVGCQRHVSSSRWLARGIRVVPVWSHYEAHFRWKLRGSSLGTAQIESAGASVSAPPPTADTRPASLRATALRYPLNYCTSKQYKLKSLT